MVGREDSLGNDEASPSNKRMFGTSASSHVPEQPVIIPSGNSSVPSGRRTGAPLTNRLLRSREARACLPPIRPLSITRTSLDEWPEAGADDGGEWNYPPTPSGNRPAERMLKLDQVPDKTSGLGMREKMSYFGKECSKVVDHIYVGGDAVAEDKNILKNNGITHILNCVALSCPEYFKSDFCYRSLWLRDRASEDITSILYDVFDYFEDVREQSGRIFVHCSQGISRSTSLVIAYLMWRERQSFDDAFRNVQSDRSIADPNMGFTLQLLQFQKRVLGLPLSPTSLLRMYKMSPHSPYDPLHLVARQLIDPSPSSLDSRGAFIIQSPSALYIWVGRQCETIMEEDAKAAGCQIARYEKVEAPVMVVREGEEPSYYWDTFAGDSVVKTQPGDRKVDAYNQDFEIFQKANEGGFVPNLASSNNEHETHLPARENSWSTLRCKFASRFEKGFRYDCEGPTPSDRTGDSDLPKKEMISLTSCSKDESGSDDLVQ